MKLTARQQDYFWNTAGVFLQSASSPILLLIVTRFNGLHDSGVFSVAFSISMILWAFGMWGGRTYQVSDTRAEFSQRAYILARIALACFMIVAAWIISLLSGYAAEKLTMVMVLTLVRAMDVVADPVYGILQANDRLHISGKSLVLKNAAGLLLFTGTILATGSMLAATFSLLASSALILYTYDLRQARHHENIRMGRTDVRRLFLESRTFLVRTASLFAVFFMSMFTLNTPRYYIDSISTTDAALFGILAMPITFIALMATFLLQPNILELSVLYGNGESKPFLQKVRNMVWHTIFLGAFILIATAWIGTDVLQWIFGVDLARFDTSLLIFIVGGVASALTLIYLTVFTIIRKLQGPLIVMLTTNAGLVLASAYWIREDSSIMQGSLLFAMATTCQALWLHLALRSSARG